MPKAGYYAVKKGKNPGVYSTWDECEQQTKGFPGSSYKKFATLREAETFIGVKYIESALTKEEDPEKDPVPSVPVPSSSGRFKPYSRPSIKVAPERSTTSTESIVAYTDGACRGNGKAGSIAGIGIWYGVNDPRNVSERCPGDQTNNRAELIAIVRCLENDPDPSKPLTIKTDSKYSIQCVRDWRGSWERREFKSASGTPVKNIDLIRYLWHLLDSRPSKVLLVHVKGHAGIEGNEGADILAGAGCTKPTKQERNWSALLAAAERTSPISPNAGGLEIDADFPVLSEAELQRMADEQDFD